MADIGDTGHGKLSKIGGVSIQFKQRFIEKNERTQPLSAKK